jgi:peptide/nickel transport system substrate-binding protein
MQRKNMIWTVVAVVVVIAAVAIGLSVASGPNSPSTTSTPPTQHQTITFAEGAGANPNYIFPYMASQYFSVDNTNQFQMLMYRPLYWFGLSSSVAYVPNLSLASSPKFTNGDKTVTFTMKGWKFADGQTVDAQSVMFFLNMYKADPTAYAGYNPGYGIPDQVRNASGSGNKVTINFTSSVNPNWLLYNYLSEITPFPNSWDLVSATQTSTCATGVYGASSTNSACKKVEKYLDAQSANVGLYTDTMWQSGDDGPWKLTTMDSLGNLTFQPNKKYSGPQKAQVASIKEVAFTSAVAEQNQLSAGSIDIGYLDPTILTASAPSPGTVGANWSPIASKYTLLTGSPWSFNYAPFNFSSADAKSAAIGQLYIRQALQGAVDQLGIIKKVDKGYGVPTYSPIPPNTPSSISAPVTNPYPFNLKSAKALLTSHGWKIVNGVQTCTDPGTAANQCGAGITRGYTLNLKIVWSSGSPSFDDTFNAEVEDWASIGIKFTTATTTFNQVIADCTSAKQLYEICSWGAGWIYAPDYYPSGETLFTTKGGFNPGGYSNPTMNTLINTTTYGTAKLTAYAKFAAQQLPVLYEPNPTAVSEIKDTLKSSIGFAPNPLGNFMPEYMHF